MFVDPKKNRFFFLFYIMRIDNQGLWSD